MAGRLFLIPVTLGDTSCDRVLPSFNRNVIAGIRHFIVEDVRSARRFLKRSNPDIVIDDLTFYVLNEHTSEQVYGCYLSAALAGEDMGVVSEAGCPAVADPGANIAAMAQKYGVSAPQLCIKYVLNLGTVALPKTCNPEHMRTNAELNFEISDEDMQTLKALDFKDYGEYSYFPVFSGK